ncbi:hypothetical protein JY651_44470 [Pyxidicoccus parkwayensis]|uniref:Lipoprotein n=1 Tax=Pyxidicoccus parkwayensis TaxID=2813578 RepID=A0ABX7NXC8_9BACT|nr:hypothetical protein [Pyxidicoccus parkwaysis]QSQ22120.1 hypothetical protein JY651_44470 [Pyxidicoccus parkwaysis]
MSPSVLRAPSRPLLAALACLLALLLPASRAEAEPGIRILNKLSTSDLALNALTTNKQALDALTTGPLNSKAFATDARLKYQLEHPSAYRVMKYLVGCALGPGQMVEWVNRSGVGTKFEGEAGLCREWEKGAPSPECLGYVSACLLARNNAFGVEVELSMRGEDSRDAKRFNPSGNSVEWSPLFLPCPSGGMGLGAECGWLGESVGTCTPGYEVTVAAGAPLDQVACTGKLGDINGDRVLRVCKDPAGCTRSDVWAETDRNACGIAPSVTFKCPDSGQYSLMSAPYDRSAMPGSWVFPQARSNGPGEYPSAPFGAFTFREGAFYGNMFDPSALSVEVLLDKDKDFVPVLSKPGFQGYPYQNVHACYSRDWVSGDSHLISRVCANATVGGSTAYACVARTAGPCEPNSTSTRPPRCKVNDGTWVYGDGDFEECLDEAGDLHPEPISVYLRNPCDLLPLSARQVCVNGKCRPKSPSECLQKYGAK